MSLPVHLVPSLAGVAGGDLVPVEGEEGHHAVAVRRLREGERLSLTDGLGSTALGEVAALGKRRLEVRVLQVHHVPRPEPELVVVQALPKGDRGERAVEVLTEIGCAGIVPWAAERCVTRWRGDRVEKGVGRWRSTAREAAKQARRSWFPDVPDLHDTDAVAALVADADLALVLHEDAARPLAGVGVPVSGRVLVVVGPEGGLTESEVGRLVGAGAVDVRLGDEVLRTSTAGLAAVAALLSRTRRWGGQLPGRL